MAQRIGMSLSQTKRDMKGIISNITAIIDFNFCFKLSPISSSTFVPSALGYKPYRDGHVQKLEQEHKRNRVIFSLQMSRWIHENGRDKCFDDVWHTDEKIFTLEWHDGSG